MDFYYTLPETFLRTLNKQQYKVTMSWLRALARYMRLELKVVQMFKGSP